MYVESPEIRSLNITAMNATEPSIEKANSTITSKELWERLGRAQRFFNTPQDDWKRHVGVGTNEKPDMPPPLYTYNSTEPPSGLYQLTQQPWILAGMVIGMLFSIALIVIGVYLQIRSYKSMRFIYLRTSSMSSDSSSSMKKWEGDTQPTKRYVNYLGWITVPGSNGDFKSDKVPGYPKLAQMNISAQDPLYTLLPNDKNKSNNIPEITCSCYNQDTKCATLINIPYTKKKLDIA